MAPDRDDDEYEAQDPSLMMPDDGDEDGGKSGATDSDMSKGVGGQREVFLGREKRQPVARRPGTHGGQTRA